MRFNTRCFGLFHQSKTGRQPPDIQPTAKLNPIGHADTSFQGVWCFDTNLERVGAIQRHHSLLSQIESALAFQRP